MKNCSAEDNIYKNTDKVKLEIEDTKQRAINQTFDINALLETINNIKIHREDGSLSRVYRPTSLIARRS